ncbi:glycosyltransferase family 2 protein [Hymenobacter sp. P5252]|uniref:Glycosyltransferase family 2 protein n=1 Tax=Hymenobacter terrestris TaxID=2748310 RepID=A0ABX2Q555_9BACT|nr:glycosyltransferase family 2 protein [Hymenobacter terrestris]
MPKYSFSIIVTVYNKEEHIDATIESILAQSFTDFELMLIDDYSTDNTELWYAYYAAVDQWVQVIKQANQDVLQARNTGLHLSTSTYI